MTRPSASGKHLPLHVLLILATALFFHAPHLFSQLGDVNYDFYLHYNWAKEFAENLPRRANQIVSALADGELELRVRAIDEDRVMRDAHRMVNRLTTGVVLAAITIAAALMTRSGTGPTLLGYPALAVVFFLLAAVGGLALVVSIVLSDRRSAKLARLSQQRRDSAVHT